MKRDFTLVPAVECRPEQADRTGFNVLSHGPGDQNRCETVSRRLLGGRRSRAVDSEARSRGAERHFFPLGMLFLPMSAR